MKKKAKQNKWKTRKNWSPAEVTKKVAKIRHLNRKGMKIGGIFENQERRTDKEAKLSIITVSFPWERIKGANGGKTSTQHSSWLKLYFRVRSIMHK